MALRSAFLVSLTLAVFVLGSVTDGAVPSSITYQGKLTDSSGVPVPDGSRAMTFRLYSAQSGGTLFWNSGVMNVVTTGGVFSAALGASPTPPLGSSVLASGEVWLEVQVGTDAPLPRVKLHSAPYALRAEVAESVADNSVTSAKIVDGTIQLADLGQNGAAANQVIKRNSTNTAWIVASDNDTTYSAGTGLSLSGTTFSLNSTYVSDNYWAQGGNAGTNPATEFVGTTDNTALEFKVNANRAMRIEPGSPVPSILGGYLSNEIGAGVIGAFVGGGGNPDDGGSRKFNKVWDHFGTIGGGVGNTAGSNDGVVDNAKHATIAGGQYNEATASLATVGGGWYNRASYERATAGGGWNNLASQHASTVGGGRDNIASGTSATVPGGASNRAQGSYSFAAGQRAKADHQGTFVWADSTAADFTSTANNQFLVRASGGVGVNTNSPATNATLEVQGSHNWAVYGRNGTSGPIGALGGLSSGVYGRSNNSHGVYGESSQTTGTGVYGINATSGKYGQLGGNTFGVASNGDLTISNGDLLLRGTGQFRGDIGPNNGAPFPRPAYDSGWLSIGRPQTLTLTHNVGLTADNYIVDMQLINTSVYGVTNLGYGTYTYYTDAYYTYGTFWHNLSSTIIKVTNHSESWTDKVRIRIWAYN